MDSTEHLEPSRDTLSTTAPDAQLNLQMSTSTWKQETAECLDEEESPCSDDTCLFMPLESSNYVNYYDSQICVLDEMKKEFPEDECSQSDCSMDSKIVCQDKESLKVIDKQQVKHKNIEEGLSLIINQENVDKKYQVTIKTERLEEQDILDNPGATSVHYDVLVTPREVQCKLCYRMFKNSFILLKHNNGHLKVVMKTSEDNEISKLHQYQYCDKGFNNYGNKLAHISDVRSKKISTCGKQFKNVPNFNRHVLLLDKLKKSPKQLIRNNLKCKYCNVDFENRYRLCKHMKLCHFCKKDEKKKYKCDSCERVFKSKSYLTEHVKRTHFEYGRMFECWCGKQFRTPIHLRDHNKCKGHDNINYKIKCNVQCDYCQKMFTRKQYLLCHIKNMHYDYGKVFECWCGKKYRTPLRLYEHKRMLHDRKVKNTNEAKFQCDSCQKVFRSKKSLLHHIKNVHYDYGKVFECWCGKDFRTPKTLYIHKWMLHGGKDKDTNEAKFQCNSCQKVLRSKYSLLQHMKRLHYDYGKVFECWCGKQFRTPMHLTRHKWMMHDGKVKNTNEANFQCDFCQKVFRSKKNLLEHIKNLHYDYGKVFECWCGKQFRTPMRLSRHKWMMHGLNVKDKNEAKFQCDSCQKVLKSKNNLLKHIKNMHYDYGKVFKCWCGKQFRTPMHLSRHKWMMHDGKDKDTNEAKFQCDSCQKVFISKQSLLQHTKNLHYDYGKVFECQCGKQFRTPLRLYQHKRRLQHDDINGLLRRILPLAGNVSKPNNV